MSMLIAAAAAFLAIHFLVAGTRLRDGITHAIGERVYLALFSLTSLAVIVWLVVAYNKVNGGADDRILYNLGAGVKDAAIPIVAIAFFLAVQSLFEPNPTAIGQEGRIGTGGAIHGVMRITRHPFLWGFAIWAAFHIAANGNLASIIFFGTFLVLSLFGTFSIDAKRKRKLGNAWTDFTRKTSNIPFAAVIAGRNELKLAESFGWRFVVATAVFLVVLFGHARFIGVSPFPGGWKPY
jgi:uncharacterized membrane protein